MDLLSRTKYLIKQTGLAPDKLKGQNFCIDQGVLEQMISAASLSSKDTVLEVGPGFGFLTKGLIEKAKRVVAIELDQKLFANLENMFEVSFSLEVINADILKVRIEDLELGRYKIVANLPYGITSRFLKKFLASGNQPESMALLLQREVAERICASAGKMSLLAVSVQLYGQPEIVALVGPEAFYPSPKVDSAVIVIKKIRPFPFGKKIDEKKYWSTIKAGFCSKRKTLENNLANSFHLPKTEVREKLQKAGLKSNIRAQELTLEDWLRLAKLFHSRFVDSKEENLI